MGDRTVYKVCTTYGGYIHSAIARGYSTHEYTIGQITFRKPSCGPLAAFNSVGDAVGWIQDMGVRHLLILECEASISSELTLYRPSVHGTETLRKSHCLNGTILCNHIKPIKEIPQTVFA